jgi:hypothetical protein
MAMAWRPRLLKIGDVRSGWKKGCTARLAWIIHDFAGGKRKGALKD